MTDPLAPLRVLKDLINHVVMPLGMELDENYFKVSPGEEYDAIEFRLNVLPDAVITEEDWDQRAYDKAFEDMIL